MITHLQHKFIIKQHVFPEILKDEKGAWGRELKIIKGLTVQGKYDSFEFWTNLNLGFLLHSTAWFITPEGSAELRKHWAMWKYTKVQEAELLAREQENILDSISYLDIEPNSAILERAGGKKKKESVVEWADS